MTEKRIAYLNGAYLPLSEAKVSVMDRAFLFADAIYEVVPVLDGKLIDFAGHIDRLERSLGAVFMPMPVSRHHFESIHHELLKHNGLTQGLVYSQITRGEAERAFTFPVKDTPQNVVLFTQNKNLHDDPMAKRGLKIISLPDLRWQRRDIKSTCLLAQTMAKQSAVEQGADDAWMVENGYVTEGTSNSAFIITDDDKIIVRPQSSAILPGITRAAMLALVAQSGLTIEERPFTIDEAKQANEAFVTSATNFVMPVVEIDGHRVGGGQPGPHSRRLRELYIQTALRAAR